MFDIVKLALQAGFNDVDLAFEAASNSFDLAKWAPILARCALVPNYELLYEITDALCRMKQLVLFALVDEFTKDPGACVFATHATESRQLCSRRK